MENLLLPRRERLFNNGGKLHFQNFSALFQGALSTSFPSGKYHCKAKSLSKTISRLRHIIVKGIKVNPSRRCVAHCSFEIALSGAAMLTLMLVCAFFSTQVQKYLAWVYNKVSLPGDCHGIAVGNASQ
ncbi:MAG: hypothetical protein SPK57_05055 [Eubacteriales bacterium]|nr:hypothetical protein [Eubacteriales bacterium]